VPSSGSAPTLAEPTESDLVFRVRPVAVLTTVMAASGTTAPVWSTTTTRMAALFGDCARAGTANAQSATRTSNFRIMSSNSITGTISLG
jgi:hypothetical protein